MVGCGERVGACRAQHVVRGVNRKAHLPRGLSGNYTQVGDPHGRRDRQSLTTPGCIVTRGQNMGGVRRMVPGVISFLRVFTVVGALSAVQAGASPRLSFTGPQGTCAGGNKK